MSKKKTYRARLTLDVPMENFGSDPKKKKEVAADMVATFIKLLSQEPEVFGKYFKVTEIEEVTK